MALNINSILAIAAIIQSIFLAVFFFQNKKGKIISNRIFAILLFVYSLSTIFSLTRSTWIGDVLISDKYYFVYIAAELSYLFGPLLFIYFKSVIDEEFEFGISKLIHFIPFIVITPLAATNIFTLFYTQAPMFGHFRLYDCSFMIVHLIGYGIACVIILKHAIEEHGLFTNTNQVKWLKFLLLASLLHWLIKIATLVSISWWISIDIFSYSHFAYFIVLFVIFYWITFNILKRPEVFSYVKKYSKSDLKKSEMEEIKNKLVGYIEETKIYLDPSISLAALAKKLAVPVPYLSRAINESFNINFCDFINRYRIEESKIHLANLSINKKTILDISYSVGFNSKSSFYEAFKKQTGLSPKKYIQSLLAD